MASVYDGDNFAGRVNYAAACFVRGSTGTRHFDTCFEMSDGEIVAAALMRRCKKNARLRDAIAKNFGGAIPQLWTDDAAKWAHVPTRRLAEASRAERARLAAEWAKTVAGWDAAR